MLVQQLRTDISYALHKNFKAGVALQCFALFIALSYFYWPQSHLIFDVMSQTKAKYDWVYSAIATALFGGIFPLLVLNALGYKSSRFGAELLCVALFWAYKGIEVDLFYQLQSHWFGDVLNVGTVSLKWQLINLFTLHFGQCQLSQSCTCGKTLVSPNAAFASTSIVTFGFVEYSP